MKLIKPTLAFALLGVHAYVGCADEELEPPRRVSQDGGGTSTGGDASTSGSDGGGTTLPDGGTIVDTGVPTDGARPDTGPRDATTDVRLDAPADVKVDAPSDAGTDSGDAATALLCNEYCACMAAECVTETPQNCVASCPSQTTWDLGCRITHCGLAQQAGADDAGRALHCGHASGVTTCN